MEKDLNLDITKENIDTGIFFPNSMSSPVIPSKIGGILAGLRIIKLENNSYVYENRAILTLDEVIDKEWIRAFPYIKEEGRNLLITIGDNPEPQEVTVLRVCTGCCCDVIGLSFILLEGQNLHLLNGVSISQPAPGGTPPQTPLSSDSVPFNTPAFSRRMVRLSEDENTIFRNIFNSNPQNRLMVAVLDSGFHYDLDSWESRRFPDDIRIWHNGEWNCTGIYDSIGMNFITNNRELYGSPFDDTQVLHGTTISRIILQNTPESNVFILPVKTHDGNGIGSLFSVLCGLSYAYSKGARIINASWVFRNRREELLPLERIVHFLEAKNVIIVTAAGNAELNGTDAPEEIGLNFPIYPACYSLEYENIIAVTTLRNRTDLINTAANTAREIINNAHFWEIGIAATEAVIEQNRLLADATAEDYSRHYVNLAIEAIDYEGHFPSPHIGEDPISGSSYATAFATALVASRRFENPNITRHEILTPSGDIRAYTIASIRSRVRGGSTIEAEV